MRTPRPGSFARMYMLIVCGGNTCRSPMAEAILQRLADDRGLEWTIGSAGVRAETATAPQAVRALRRRGLEPTSRPVQLTEQLVRDASVVFCMTGSQRSLVAAAMPGSAAKIHTWAAFIAQRAGAGAGDQPPGLTIPDSGADAARYDVADPIGQSDEIYEQTAATIEYLAAMTVEVLTHAGPTP